MILKILLLFAGQVWAVNSYDATPIDVIITTETRIKVEQTGSFTVTPGTGTWTTSQQGSITVTQGTASITSNAWLIANPSTNTTNTYFGTSSSPSINAGLLPMKFYALQVLGIGATPTSWTVNLEGSVNNSTFTTILQHTQAIGDGILLYSGANIYPSLYIRSRVSAVSLGGATSIAVTILGTQ